MRAVSGEGQDPLVTVVIPNYNGREFLHRCVQSLLQQSYSKIELVVIDNGSTDDSVKLVNRLFPTAKVKLNAQNVGFAKAVNQGIDNSSGEYLLVLNNDTELRLDCVERLVSEMRRLLAEDAKVMGLAPKIVFDRLGRVFLDAVGVGMNPDGAAFNIGIGQADFGQLDSSTRVFGLCFAAAFIRRKALDMVGKLDERFYAYYEDVDWCYRANVLGYKFYSAPSAVIYHKHSGSALLLLSDERKYTLIHRNYIRTMLKNFYRGNLIRVLPKLGRHVLEAYSSGVKRNFDRLRTHLRIIFGSMLLSPLFLLQNLVLNRHRLASDASIWGLSSARLVQISGISFDPESYSPRLNVEILVEIFRSLAEMDPTMNFDRYTSLILLSLIKQRVRLPKVWQLPDRKRGTYVLKNILASKKNGEVNVLTTEGSLILEPFIYKLILCSDGNSELDVVRSIGEFSASRQQVDHRVRVSLDILWDLLCRAGILGRL